MFLLGILATLALPALCWALMAETRLRNFAADFRALDSGLWLLFLVCVGSHVLPVVTAVVVGTDMPSLWALQGLFLVVILIVCGARYSIARFYTVNLAVLVMAIAAAAVTLAAPAHAVYRNAYCPNERTYYSLAAAELTREWHQYTGAALTDVSGDDGLAFATAFYTADHPVYLPTVHLPPAAALPDEAAVDKGWAAVCFASDRACVSWMERIAATVPHVVRTRFEVTPQLWGQPGVSTGIAAIMALPRDDIAQLEPPRPDDVKDPGAGHLLR
jgi:hypothetical protein